MKNFIFSLLSLFLTFGSLFGQRDTEHWIAPYYASTTYTQALYLSTDSLTPFDVTIYSNNVALGTVTISKNSPQTYTVPAANIAATTPVEAFQVINKGLYLNAAKPFYCTLRMVSGTTHAEIVTSKGKAGIGKEFYVAATPSPFVSTGNNFTAGILATENATSVTVTWNAGVTFLGSATTATTHTFVLNKGESFIFAGNGVNPSNMSAFIGAKIVSDKPVTLTNGNVNGNFGTVSNLGSDAILDQSVPVERLGNTFAMVQTRSTAADLEGGIVIATENNTEVFLNGSATPAATLNQGEWYRISGDAYVLQGTLGHANMYITTSKNVYLYQFVAVKNSSATCGFNYIPPLNCFLPRKIDEIGKINEMPLANPTPSDMVIKLNILTEAGATVMVNSFPPTADQGPYPLTGNSAWVTYAIEGITGNVTIVSDKAVTAGINGGYNTSGYGGYFAGFSSIPVISKKSGECVPGIILELNDGYDTYQWFLNGVAIPGATTYTYTPTQAGNYTVKVTMGSCPPVTTPIYKVFPCLHESTSTVNACASKVITPVFSNSSQTPDGNTVTIITPPAHGTVTAPNPTTGAFTYTPNPGYLGPDLIVYQFCSTTPEFKDCEKVTLQLNVVPFILTDTTVKACQYYGKGIFDLTKAAVTTYTPVVKKFYLTMADLNSDSNPIADPVNYNSAAGIVYVKVITSEGCTGTAKITLAFLPSPVVQDASLSECFLSDNESKSKFDLTTANVTSETPVTKKYYPTFADADNGTNEIQNATGYTSSNTIVYARVYNADGCYSIAKITLHVIPPKRSPILVDKIICIDEKTSLDAGPGYASYQWSTGAATQSIDNIPVGSYWVILEDNGCFVKQPVNVKKSQDPVIQEIEISNNTATVMVTGGKTPYLYAVDAPTNWQNSNVFTGLTRGQHTFYVKDTYNCTPVSVELTVPNLINAITPNGDHKNDFIDYSELAYKENLSFVVYDRYGNKIFTGNKFNDYKWDGKHYDKKIATGTYWYHINWNESNKEKTPIQYTGWILVKNIE
ncbi:T9SS type B sorting domain-containing protein [Chryseobacterium sp. JK1]|uniref:T9SS type B sorting domain-containing protein n=1 Tax=Chryseobacterium sp. JK1 TaxID=874294 RepID=UPI003D683070